MAETHVTIDQIEVTVSGFLTSRHLFQTEAGAWGECTFRAFSGRVVFQGADGRILEMRRTRWLGGSYALTDGEVIRGTAERLGILHRAMSVQFDGQEYRLAPEGVLGQGWYLETDQGDRLLEIRTRGLLRQGAYLTVLGPVDSDLIVFAYYLVHERWQEEAAAASTAAAS